MYCDNGVLLVIWFVVANGGLRSRRSENLIHRHQKCKPNDKRRSFGCVPPVLYLRRSRIQLKDLGMPQLWLDGPWTTIYYGCHQCQPIRQLYHFSLVQFVIPFKYLSVGQVALTCSLNFSNLFSLFSSKFSNLFCVVATFLGCFCDRIRSFK